MAALLPVKSLNRTHAGQSIAPSAPSKYIMVGDVRYLNPDFAEEMERQHLLASTALHPGKALPVVCNMGDYQEFGKLAPASLAWSTEEARGSFAATAQRVGLAPQALEEQIGVLCAKFDIPMGMLHKLMGLKTLDRMDFIFDDSFSMSCSSGSTSRWIEARDRMKTLIEIMAYFPTPPIVITFLNRPDRVVLERRGEEPRLFIERSHAIIDQLFVKPPAGSTPVLRALHNSFVGSEGLKVARYLYCDGVPDGGKPAQEAITKMIKERKNPEGNPVTFFSCTDQPKDVAWTRETEETTECCAEYDDFGTEAEAVAGAQGLVMPYTRGIHLVSELVGAMNPDDLDALDEPVPLTKWTLDNMMGVVAADAEYGRYFAGFEAAQRARPVETTLDLLKQEQQWAGLFNDFLTAKKATDIPAVQEYQYRVKNCPVAQVLPPPGY